MGVRLPSAYVFIRGLGYRQSEVAAYFGRDTATLAALLARLSDRMQSDEKQKRELDSLTKILESSKSEPNVF
jgi:hypothetical protein